MRLQNCQKFLPFSKWPQNTGGKNGDVWETFGNSILLLSYLVMYVHVVQSLSFIYIYIYTVKPV